MYTLVHTYRNTGWKGGRGQYLYIQSTSTCTCVQKRRNGHLKPKLDRNSDGAHGPCARTRGSTGPPQGETRRQGCTVTGHVRGCSAPAEGYPGRRETQGKIGYRPRTATGIRRWGVIGRTERGQKRGMTECMVRDGPEGQSDRRVDRDTVPSATGVIAWRGGGQTRNVKQVFARCPPGDSLCSPLVLTSCSPHVCQVFAPCSLSVHQVFARCSPGVRRLFISCFPLFAAEFLLVCTGLLVFPQF
jgi:hypothetical protein